MYPKPNRFRNGALFVLCFTALLWVVKGLEWAVHLDFGFLGILPRTLTGTMGIITAPLIHGDMLHLVSNTFPLILLGISVFYFYDRIALEVFGWIYFMSGFWVWMAARDAYHIGASGLVYGLVAFLFFSGVFRRDTRSLAISLVVIFIYGGMVQGLFPGNENISWESHLLGALAGAFCAFFYRETPVFGTTQKQEAAVPLHSYAQMQDAASMPGLQDEEQPFIKPLKSRQQNNGQKPIFSTQQPCYQYEYIDRKPATYRRYYCYSFSQSKKGKQEN